MSDSYSLGIITDTHDVEEPLGIVDSLARLDCDHNVHLGDIGGARAVREAVHAFKRYLGNGDHLPEAQRARYRAAVSNGVPAMKAYIETVLDPAGDGSRSPVWASETAEVYDAIFKRFESLANPVLLRGNVDGMQLRSPVVQEALARSHLRLVNRPYLVDLGWLGLLFWPSWRPEDEAERAELTRVTRDLAAGVAAKQQVIVLAHEQLFKGPSAAVYTGRIARAGFCQRTVPRFNPNPTWAALLALFRSLPADVDVTYVFGHVHDPLAVILAGAPALADSGSGMRYRLFGVGWRGQRPRESGSRRSILMLPVGAGEIAVLEVRRAERVRWHTARQD